MYWLIRGGGGVHVMFASLARVAVQADGTTALIFAAMKGRNDVAALLLDVGADVNATKVRKHCGAYPAAVSPPAPSSPPPSPTDRNT
jgi:hypothetical protein